MLFDGGRGSLNAGWRRFPLDASSGRLTASQAPLFGHPAYVLTALLLLTENMAGNCIVFLPECHYKALAGQHYCSFVQQLIGTLGFRSEDTCGPFGCGCSEVLLKRTTSEGEKPVDASRCINLFFEKDTTR